MAERDARGRFVKGEYRGGPGRPPRENERQYLDILVREVTPELWAGICRRAIADALRGNSWARAWVSDFLIGRPPVTLNINAADAKLLADVLKAFEQRGQSASAVFHAMLAEVAITHEDENDSG